MSDRTDYGHRVLAPLITAMPSQVGAEELLKGRHEAHRAGCYDCRMEYIDRMALESENGLLKAKLKKWKKRARLRGYMRPVHVRLTESDWRPTIRKSDSLSKSDIAERDGNVH